MSNEEYMTTLDLTPNEDAAVAEELDDGSVEVEVVDDTPESDRNRKPLPAEVARALDEPDTEEYSSKVKQRIDQMKKAWHDERRAKESATRERDEAIRIAQQAYNERSTSMQRLQDGEVWAMEQAKQRAILQLANAKQAYKQAYEEGDSDKLVDAQQGLTQSMAEVTEISRYRPQYAVQPENNDVYTQPTAEPEYEAPTPDQRAVDWNAENTWFGSDDEMTSFALGVHQKLVKEGHNPQSDEYYAHINARMRAVFPGSFGKKRQPSTVVAPVGRSPKGRKVVLTQTQVALSKRLGITPEQYARELAKQQEM